QPLVNGDRPVALDNKLNYIHDDGGGLDESIAAGLVVWLNSSFVDHHFRTFSGHTQVNATDLRAMPFPPLSMLKGLGAGSVDLAAQDQVDEWVEAVVFGQA